MVKRCPVRSRVSQVLVAVVLSGFVFLSPYILSFGHSVSSQTKKLSASESALVSSSRAAILATGISAAYFDQHFTLVRVVDRVSDRRVLWSYSIGEYVTALNDAVGFYTDESGKRINVHSVRNDLLSSHDIKSTIPKKRAELLMRQCIGRYTLGPILLQSFGASRRASLLFTASSVAKQKQERRKDQRRESERERRGEDERRASQVPRDTVEEGDDEGDNDGLRVITGFVNLETGACTKGIAQADHPLPSDK